ncbi:UbiA prenyltransferase family-domain-containing protein [Daldinia decipiens]|uniref:UbiA prenyltransferase family-domain-containing protein n=1 Tax=Daldinia decipiens TaxID=326647 RepID=UPI0020C36D63|nr:UbiA prenyltransferase family-domain-containing protein [Daldinia decipiens]KAI1656817.1 UbiA prenyltransferase family-domain-containing protein [Daldinia decipiens]
MSDTQGNRRRWYDCLPSSWVPYMELCHISTPAPIFLIYFPHLYGVIYAAIVRNSPVAEVLHMCSVLLTGTIFFSNAAHAWNDLIDAPIDKMIRRTKNRPIPRGAISPLSAFIFALIHAFGAACHLLVLPRDTAICTLPTVLGTTYYPWAKRHTYFPQVVLGFCLAWGAMVGASAMGIQQPWTKGTAICLFLACLFWTVMYDTIYSHMDLEEDIKIGVKSMAVYFQGKAKLLLWFVLVCMISSLILCGNMVGLGRQYMVTTVGGCLASQAMIVQMVDLKDPQNCWWWFANGFWVTGGLIAGGLVSEYVIRSV